MLYTLAVLISGILWGTMGLFVRPLTAMGYTRLHLVCVRAIVTVIVVGAAMLIRDRKAFKIKPSHLWIFFGSGVVSILFFSYCYFTTITLTDLSTACILLYTAPIFVMLISLPVFREKLSVAKVAALVLAFGGCLLVSGTGADLTTRALLLGLGSGIGYGLYSIFTRLGTLRGYGPMTVTFYTFVFCTVGCLFISDVPAMCRVMAAQPGSIPTLVLLGLVTSVLPYLLYSWGLTGMEPSRASIIASIEPVAATAFGIFVYSESLTLSSAIGIALVLCAIAVLSIKKNKVKEEK